MAPTTCKELIKDYCSNCSFAGFRFIADDTKHWLERWIWLGLVALSWYGSALLILAAWQSFVDSPISFGVDTLYVDWNTTVPAVAVCETANDKQIYNVSDTIWPPDHLLDLEDTLKEIAYYRGISYALMRICHSNRKPNPLCLMSNYSYYASLVRSDCSRLIRNCSYNAQPFECCEYFLPINTDIGTCFIINSGQIEQPNPYPMIINMKQKQGILRFEVWTQSMMYTLGPDEIPTITTIKLYTMKINIGYNYQRRLAVRNIDNDPLLVHNTVEQRACKFRSENVDGALYPHYSFSACTVLCRKRAQMEICQCNDHFMLDTPLEHQCNISGLACLHAQSGHFTTLKPAWARRPGLVCGCIPACGETEVTVIKDVSTKNRKEKKKSTVEVVLAQMPSERFKRNVVRSQLDLVVSIGGTTGLFLGASLLSFVELIFYFTIRFASNVWMEQRKRRVDVLQPQIRESYENLNNFLRQRPRSYGPNPTRARAILIGTDQGNLRAGNSTLKLLY